MTFGKVAGFFLDACILLPHSLETDHEACSHFLNNIEKDYFISYSIRKEAFDISNQCYSVICDNLRENLKHTLEENGVKHITNRDGKVIAKAFSKQKRNIVTQFPTRTNVRNELIGVIENYIANQVHSLKDGASIEVDVLLANTLIVLQKARYDIEKPFKTVRVIHIEPHDALTSLSSLRAQIVNKKDVSHIASAIQYQFEENKWVIFVTNDEKDILNNETQIWENFALQCTKPCWALDYYREMTKLKPPREFYKDIRIPSKTQKDFAAAIEKITHTSIIRSSYIPF